MNSTHSLNTDGGHDFYQTGDMDAPVAIKDRNGEVTLGLCRTCGQGEGDLALRCPGPPRTLAADTPEPDPGDVPVGRRRANALTRDLGEGWRSPFVNFEEDRTVRIDGSLRLEDLEKVVSVMRRIRW